MELADVAKASRFHGVFVMFSRFSNFSDLTHHQAMGTFFESKGISEAEQKSKLILSSGIASDL
jgi:hypothetical protein